MPPESSPRTQLIEVALPLFGERGLEGASTRDIAAAAGKPMSAITYHFGGKDALYLACAEHISETIGGFIGAALDGQEGASTPLTKAQARADIRSNMALMIHSVLRPETEHFARFIMREQQEPTAAFDVIYSGMMGRMLTRLAARIEILGAPRIDALEARVRALAIMGQVLVFRVARAAVLRLTGWTGVDEPERAMIQRIIDDQIESILDRLEREEA